MLGNNRIRMISPPVRRVYGVIETFENDINLEYITSDTYLKTITIERVGEEGKFFGFGICQKLNTHLTKSDYPISTATTIKAVIFDDNSFYSDMFPPFKVTEVHKDENNGELSITAYDAIYRAAEHTIDEIKTTVTTIEKFAKDIALFLGCKDVYFIGSESSEACFNCVYNETALANYEGTETIRSVLDDIAEATQTIYYINNNNHLVFKRLDKDGLEALTITKDDYITLDSGENRRLTNLVSATELGDNLTAILKGKAKGALIRVDNVADNEHTVEVTTNATNITRCGKNLAPTLAEGEVVDSKGVTFTGTADGGIRVSGTPTDVAVIQLGSIVAPTRQGKLTISLSGDFYNIVPDFKLLDTNGTLLKQVQTSNKETVNLADYPTAATWVMAIKRLANNVEVSGTVYFQVEYGETATAYEKYNAQSYTVGAEGKVEGVTSLAPTMTIYSNIPEAEINIKYERSNVISGTTQYIRNNPFWDLRADRAQLVDDALTAVWGMTINQFDCVWRGNPQLEIGDKIALITKDNEKVISYVLNDVIDYSGGLTQRTSWHYTESEETASNPSNLGELLTQTYAKVDKVNKRIEMVVSATDGNTETLNQLVSDKDGIVASVERVEKRLTDDLAPITSDIAELTKSVEAQITAEDVRFAINTEIEKGAQKVVTSTGYTFNEEGLTVEKSGSEMKTTISDDGMRVYRDNHEVLTADNRGVKAENLHATTYLIIGTNSRFEDYGGRTGCFWIG